jgi:hypothetical protein
LQRTGGNLNPNHSYAMQPLVLEIKNKNDQNYPNGIVPGENFTGINFPENIGDLGVLGERSDPMLERTLNYISTGAKTFNRKDIFVKTILISNSKLGTLAGNNMYTEIK